MRVMLLVVVASLACSCASRSGVFRIDENTYQTSTRATWEFGGRAGAKTMALEEATRYCQSQGKALRIVSSKENYGHFEGGTVDLIFACDTPK